LNQSEDESTLNQILNEIINSAAGLRNAIIIDDTGITIASRAKFTLKNIDEVTSAEKIGAISGAVFTAAEEQGQILGYGSINLQITEYNKGMLFSINLGNGSLCLATDLDVQIGFIKAMLKKWAPKITHVLKRYLKSDQKGIKEELKDLFSMNTLEP
jgi:predicted regulator of Ras-like GTPase activity (Roadblock/LC7/MglB family)